MALLGGYLLHACISLQRYSVSTLCNLDPDKNFEQASVVYEVDILSVIAALLIDLANG